jgi:polysaccharide transporter, PST family
MGVVQLVSLGLPLLSLPYLAAVLGAEQLGRMAFALSVAQILVILTDYGFNLSASKAVSVNRHNPDKVAEIWCSVTLVRVLLALAGLACIGISALMFERARNELGLFLIAYVMVLGNVLYPQWLFQGLEKLKIISMVQLVARVIVFSLIFILVKSSSDIYWATFLQAGGYLFGGILALPLTLNALGPKRLRWPSPYKLIEQLKQGWHVFISAAAINIYTSSNAFVLGLFVEPAMLAYFHIAEKLIRAVQTLYGPISNAVYPHVSKLALNGPEEVLRFNRSLLIRSLGAASIVSATVFITAPFVIDVMFGHVYLPAAGILRVFSLLPVIIVASNIFGILTMLPLGMESAYSRIYLSAAIVNVVTFIPATLWFGVVGAAWANVTVELVVTISMALQLKRAIGKGLLLSFR